ncbi:phenylacetic acid degradation protein PaaN [Streptomyces sp. UNOC14_S4]|uniref:phenylacetic acid degradation protein PaaN n=1 Tax=Streptomyces sp. UNOC14_S4 TaxID=2872340 RepID=UPI001E54593C|nr:phenylacetic acid degradation protein PaaN [Streptomyces sp. UNOC14_S4]MCC3771272.1 phenylacetic acid degradation protein PaaN [Streptomyces sp. UNOC14_S4]
MNPSDVRPEFTGPELVGPELVRQELAGLVGRHRATLDRALEVIGTRAGWSPYPEDEGAYAVGAAQGATAHHATRGRHFALGQPGEDGTVGPSPAEGGEKSPFGPELGISYPHHDPVVLLPAMRAAIPAWRDAGVAVRAAVCAEILARVNARSHEFAQAAAHTSGHNPVMAFHAGAVHAQDRGLEAVAYAVAEQTRLPETARWSKPQPDGTPFVLDKTFKIRPRGIGLVIGNSVFPAWNGYPGFFASLATGNAVLVKPHPRAVLPLALTVRVAREVLRETGFDADLVCLAPERPGEALAKTLATHPDVRIVDYAGSAPFGAWLRTHARQAQLHLGTSAVNSLLIDSTAHYRDMLDNLAFSLALYSGQLCTSPQNLLIPRDGIPTDEGHKSFDEVVADLGGALGRLLADDGEASAVLGALVGPEVLARVEKAASGALGEPAVAPRAVVHPEFPDAVIRTPAVVALDANRPEDLATLSAEWLGPVFFAVAVDSAADGIALLARTAREQGALSAGAYTTSPAVEEALEAACAEAGVMLSLNLMGQWYITQSAVYSDLHGTGMNPAAESVYCDTAFVAGRFRTVGVRRYGAKGR